MFKLIVVLALASACAGAPPTIAQPVSVVPDSHETLVLDEWSVFSLYLQLLQGEAVVGSATGFVVAESGAYYLITNYHVLSGRHPSTGSPLPDLKGRIPTHIRIYHHGIQLGTWVPKTYPLYEKGLVGKAIPKWRQHPSGSAVDVVALPLPPATSQLRFYSLDISLAQADVLAAPARAVSIIGFPLGLSGPGLFPIWKTGHIASEPELDYRGKPIILVDAATRGGMSGSPVVIRVHSGYLNRRHSLIVGRSAARFLGVYSGRIGGDSDVGIVWKPTVISQILMRP